MGLCNSKTMMPQGNLIVDGFVRYAQGNSGWVKERGQFNNKDIHLEVFKGEKPLGAWRGYVFLDNTSLEDALSYINFKLGADSYELLASEDDEFIFREIFDLSAYEGSSLSAKSLKSPSSPNSNKFAKVGDHRGDNTERLTESSMIQESRKLSITANAVHRKTLTGAHQEPLVKVNEVQEVGEEDEDLLTGKRGFAYSKEDSKDSKEDSDSDEDEDLMEDEFKPALQDTHTNAKSVTDWLGISASSTAANINKHESMKATNQAKSGRIGSKERREPRLREMIFKRQDFKLDGDIRAVVSIAQSVKYSLKKSAINSNTHRATVRMRGVLIEEFVERKKQRVKVTFLCSMDPDLAEWETPLVSSQALCAFGGKFCVESFLLEMMEKFESADSRLIMKFRQFASANTGNLEWKELGRIKNELQLGTNVTHKKYGHGIVQSFDMKGRVRVVYDNKEVVDHSPEEKNDLNVSVLIGTRVKHKEKGFGTVKAFDESGRVHVKFDNGEMHRYKQAAWKKKMHTVKLVGIGGALGTVKLSVRPFPQVREGMGRVKFAVGVTTQEVLKYILLSNTASSADEQKGGSILERRVVEQVNANQRVIYENRRMPPPLAPRDFVFREMWLEVAPMTFAVVYETVKRADIPEKPQTVRAEMFLTGWLLEPLYLESSDDHVCRVTYQLCIDTKGFVAPEAVESVRQSLLLGAVTDTRAFFWEQSHAKQNVKLNKNYNASMTPEQQQGALSMKGFSSMVNVLKQ